MKYDANRVAPVWPGFYRIYCENDQEHIGYYDASSTFGIGCDKWLMGPKMPNQELSTVVYPDIKRVCKWAQWTEK